METKLVWILSILFSISSCTPAREPTTATSNGKNAQCPDESGWDETTWPVFIENGRHFIRVLHLYSDANGESHGREQLLPTELTPAPGGDGLDFYKVPNIPFSLGFIGDVPGGFDNSHHTTPSRRFISFPYGEVCITTSDGKSWHMRPNRIALAEDTVGKGHATRTLNNRAAIFLHSVLAPDAEVPLVEPTREGK